MDHWQFLKGMGGRKFIKDSLISASFGLYVRGTAKWRALGVNSTQLLVLLPTKVKDIHNRSAIGHSL